MKFLIAIGVAVTLFSVVIAAISILFETISDVIRWVKEQFEDLF
jgi:hypothetical protein